MWLQPDGVSKCPKCNLPIEYRAATCPYCYHAIYPWSLASPWVLTALTVFVIGLLAVIALDQFAGLGILKWVLAQIKPGQ